MGSDFKINSLTTHQIKWVAHAVLLPVLLELPWLLIYNNLDIVLRIEWNMTHSTTYTVIEFCLKLI